MPRRSVVDRTVQAIEIEYTAYDKEINQPVHQTIRLPDKSMSERKIKDLIESMQPTQTVIEITKISVIKVKYSMPLEQYMSLATVTYL